MCIILNCNVKCEYNLVPTSITWVQGIHNSTKNLWQSISNSYILIKHKMNSRRSRRDPITPAIVNTRRGIVYFSQVLQVKNCWFVLKRNRGIRILNVCYVPKQLRRVYQVYGVEICVLLWIFITIFVITLTRPWQKNTVWLHLKLNKYNHF